MFGRSHLGVSAYAPCRANFGALPNGALPATTDSGQVWIKVNGFSYVVASGLMTPGGTLLVDPGLPVQSFTVEMGPPFSPDAWFLLTNWVDANNFVQMIYSVGTPSGYTLYDVIGGVVHQLAATVTTSNDADHDRLTLASSGHTVTLSRNGVVLQSVTSAVPGTKTRLVGLNGFGNTGGVRQFTTQAFFTYP